MLNFGAILVFTKKYGNFYLNSKLYFILKLDEFSATNNILSSFNLYLNSEFSFNLNLEFLATNDSKLFLSSKYKKSFLY